MDRVRHALGGMPPLGADHPLLLGVDHPLLDPPTRFRREVGEVASVGRAFAPA